MSIKGEITVLLSQQVSYWKRFDKTAEDLKREFLALLDGDHVEQVFQDYIEKNTRLIPREFVQNHGINFQLVLRKVPMGADYKPDFVYLSKSSVRWNCILVEIEKPQSRYFKDGAKLEYHPDFIAGLHQIDKWKSWFLDQSNKDSFCNGTIGPMRQPLHDNPVDIKYVLVHGRRSECAENIRKRRLIAAKEAPDFRIMSYDSLTENLENNGDLYVGVKKNEYIEIVSNKFLSENIFSWMDVSQISISSELKADIEANRAQWSSHKVPDYKNGEKDPQYVLDSALKKIHVRLPPKSSKIETQS